MPPRRAPARRTKPSPKDTTTPLPETESSHDLISKETISLSVSVSDPNLAAIQVVGSELMNKEEENGVVEEDTKEKDEDEQPEDEDPEEYVDGPQLEHNAEINSAQEETTAVQVDDSNILNDNNNDVQDSDISKSLCKDNDSLVGNNEDIKDTTDMASIQESAQDVSTQASYENKTALAIEEDSMEDLYDDESEDDSEGVDADNVGGEDQDPSFVGQDSSPDNKKEKGTELYVGKLDKNVVEEDLVNIFQQFGELKSTRIVRKPTTNKSKGFAFVRFASVDQAKRALSELKDVGVEVRGKRVVISASQDNDTLYLGNICKTWTNEQVLQQLKEYGVEHIEVLRIPEDTKADRKNKGFAFLEFHTHADAIAAFKRLKKPDVFFGRDINAKVAFSETPKPSDEDLSHVNEVHLEGVTKDWTEEKVKDICKQYGEILKINLRPRTRSKHKDFGFVTFSSSESALACVEGINNTAFGVEPKIKASIAKAQQKGLNQKQGFRGGHKVEKQSENANKKSQPKSLKMKGVLNSHQTKTNKKYPSKNKLKDNTVKPQQKGPQKIDGETSKEAELSKMKGDNDSQHGKRKRKAYSEQKSNARDMGTPKKPRNGGQGPNSQSASKGGSHKRKRAPGNEVREDRGNRNAQGKKPFKKQKGNMRGRERDNYRKPKGDGHTRRGHDDYRNPTRYIDPYAPKYNAYHVASDHSLSTRRYKEMEPHAGYIEPAFAKQSGSHSGYAYPHSQHQSVYLGSASTGQSQLYPRYVDQPAMTQSRRGYVETVVAPEVQHYRDYRPSATVQVARDPYDSGFARIVRHDDRGAGGGTYVGGPPLPASQVPSRTNYYQAGGSYGGAYGTRGGYY